MPSSTEDSVPIDELTWLMKWYASQCDDLWEHGFGVKIESLDNPGWRIEIDLRETAWEKRPFDQVAFNLDAPDGDVNERWHQCHVKDRTFYGYGGAFDLVTIIRVFREWVEQ